MKILIIETAARSNNPIDAHVRNAIAIKKGLVGLGHKCDLLFISDRCDDYGSDYDLILVSYATFYPIYDNMEDLLDRNEQARLGWITNEYNLNPNGMFFKRFKKQGAFMLSNFEVGAVTFSCFKNYHSVNLNLFLYKEYPDIKKSEDFIYYGTFRIDRQEYFKKYLTKHVFVSTSTKNMKKYKHIGCTPRYIKKLNWKNPLIRRFKYSLYMEDTFTHDNFNNLANRFYESLGAGCVVLFDKGCINTLKLAGIKNYEEFIVDGEKDLLKFKNRNFAKLLKKQEIWKADIRKQQKKLIKDIERILIEEVKSHE